MADEAPQAVATNVAQRIAQGEPSVPIGTPRKPAEPQYATVDQFRQLLGAVKGLAEKIETMPQANAKPVDEAGPIGSAGVEPEIPVNPKWRQMVNEILGTDFGMDVRYSKDGDVIYFTILVPLDKSNARPDYKEYYGIDRRTISLNPAQTGIGIKQWCEKIKRNLSRSVAGESN